VQAKNSGDIGVGEIGIPRKGVGYFVRVAWNPFACELGFRPDQYLCHFLDTVKWAVFASLKLLLCIQPSAVVLSVYDQMQEISGRFRCSKSTHGPTIEAKNSRTFRVARFFKSGGIAKRQARPRNTLNPLIPCLHASAR
jgi:hypothetical protein